MSLGSRGAGDHDRKVDEGREDEEHGANAGKPREDEQVVEGRDRVDGEEDEENLPALDLKARVVSVHQANYDLG